MSMKMGRKENMKAKSFCVTEGEGRGIGILSIPTQLQGGGGSGEIKTTIVKIAQFDAFYAVKNWHVCPCERSSK